MKSTARWIAMLAVALMALSPGGCLWEEDEDDDKQRVAAPWELIARYIDAQLGEVAMDPMANCDGQNVASGTHCKNRLDGTVGYHTTTQIVENSVFEHYGSGLFLAGLVPIHPDLCTADGDTDGVPDYDVCQGGTVTCEEQGTGSYLLEFIACMVQSGGTFSLDGQISADFYTASEDESMAVTGYHDYMVTELDPPGATAISSLLMNGTRVVYLKIDPLVGNQAMGTTGSPDGMTIVRAELVLDPDGAGAALPYYLSLHNSTDTEEWPLFSILLSGGGQATVLAGMMPDVLGASSVDLIVYDRSHPWDGGGYGVRGCYLRILNVDEVNRTYDVKSASMYGLLGCLTDNTISYGQ